MDALKTILYFSIFRYPLKKEEIHSFTSNSNLDETEKELQFLIEKKVIYPVKEFYVYGTDTASIQKRIKGNNAAEKAIIKADKRAKLIAKFPFVEAVGISGSLSKKYFDETSDVDFFIITKPNHLWTCRTLLVLYKKTVLLNSRKYFCLNYFISSDFLEIEEKNRFTATEISTLIPLYGTKVFKEFFTSNSWAAEFFPYKKTEIGKCSDQKPSFLSLFTEKIFSGKIGKIIESCSYKITFAIWKKKFSKKIDPVEFTLAFKSTRRVSKHHPSNFQKKIIDALNDKYEEIRINHTIILTPENV